MANWAGTEYTITGKQKDINELYDLIDAFCNDKRKPLRKDASNNWEGNIVLAIGEKLDSKQIRGFISFFEKRGNTITLQAEEAYCHTDFKDCLEKHYQGMKILFYCTEFGCNVFETNDKDGEAYPWKFAVKSEIDGDYEEEYFATKKEAVDYVGCRIGDELMTEEDIAKWNKLHESDDNYANIYEFEITD